MTSTSIVRPSPRGAQGPSTWRRFARSYAGQAVLSPFHCAVLACLGVAALISQSVLPLLCGAPLTEALVFVALPRSTLFRRVVDRGLRVRERAARDARRGAQLLRMHHEHRTNVDALMKLDASIRARLPAAPFEETSVDRLIDLYITIAVTHDEAQRVVSENHLDEDTAPEIVCPDAACLSDQRRQHRALALRRREQRRENRERLALLRDQLDAIDAAVKLLHERTILAGDPAATAAKIEELLDEIEESAPVVQSLIALSAELERA